MTGAGLIISILAEGDDRKLLWGVPLVLGLAACVGLGNGLGITVLGIPPIVMTLAMDVVLNGAVVLYALGHGSQASAPQPIQDVLYGHLAGIPGYLLVMLVTLVVFSALLSLTTYGRRLYAVGTSLRVSRFSGVDVRRVIIASYMLSSIAAATGGMLLLAYVNNAFFGMGDPYLFTSISAVVVGGASILGGSGHFIGTLGGALLLTVANALLVVYSLGPGAISIFYGLIILVSVTVLSSRVSVLGRVFRRAAHRA
jgi:ribose transport system permease protein